MGFDPKAALIAAKQGVKIGSDIADKTVETINKVADGKTDREIRVSTSKTDQVLRCIDAGSKALDTAASIYEKLSQSRNRNKEIDSKIRDSRENFELEKKKLDK